MGQCLVFPLIWLKYYWIFSDDDIFSSFSSYKWKGKNSRNIVTLQNEGHNCCVPIRGLHLSKDTFEGQLHHNAAWRLSQFEGSFKCSPQMWPSFPSFWRIHRCYLSQPHVSQDPPPHKSDNGDNKLIMTMNITVGSNNKFTYPLSCLNRRFTSRHWWSPPQAAKATSFEGCSPWTWAQLTFWVITIENKWRLKSAS